MPGGHLLPCLRVLFGLLAWPAWVLGGLGGLLPSDEGRRALACKGGGNSLGKTVVFPGRGSASLGRSTSFPSLTFSLWGGQRSTRSGRTCQGRPVVFPGRGSTSLGRSTSFPSLTVSLWGGREALASPWGGLAGETCCLPWGEKRPGRIGLPDCLFVN